MGGLQQAFEFIGGDEGDISPSTPTNHDDLPGLHGSIEELREIRSWPRGIERMSELCDDNLLSGKLEELVEYSAEYEVSGGAPRVSADNEDRDGFA